jgi:hypothetical protein
MLCRNGAYGYAETRSATDSAVYASAECDATDGFEAKPVRVAPRKALQLPMQRVMPPNVYVAWLKHVVQLAALLKQEHVTSPTLLQPQAQRVMPQWRRQGHAVPLAAPMKMGRLILGVGH